MPEFSYKYFSTAISFLLHSLLIISFYFIAIYAPSKTSKLLEIDIATSPGNINLGGSSVQTKIIEPPSLEEKYIKAEKNSTATIPSKTSANPKDSKTAEGTGTGEGTGNASGISLGLTPPVKPKEDIYLVAVDEMPEPIGGIEKIVSKIKYPTEAKQKGINGTVFVLAFIDENGSVRKTLLTKGIGGGCDEAALRAVSFARFKPGKNKGQYVKVQVQIPIPFY